MDKYNKLKEYYKKIYELQCVLNILVWDLRMNTPKDAKDFVISLETELEEKLFNLKTDKIYEKMLLDCINSDYFNNLDDIEKRYINKLLKRYYNDIKIPIDFYSEYVSLCSKTTSVWEEAKRDNNYELFKPYLKKIIEMSKQYYSFIDSDKNLYDVMLEQYEDGMTSDIIDILFDELKKFLIPLIKKVTFNNSIVVQNDYTNDELLVCAKYLLNYIGFNNNRGTLGIYPHGFTGKVSTNDVRIAFSKTNDPISFVSTIIHEGGHGIFEQNVSELVSVYGSDCMDNLFGLHESQSRFFENILGRNINFWIPIYEDIKKKLNLEIEVNEFVQALNTVKPGNIRVDADELTYCLHIIIRYEIERDLFDGKITVDELPNIWNEKMKDYLGVEVSDDREGLMQDIHWAEGGFGYFPSYLLGTIYDGIFLEYVEDNLGSIDKLLNEGNVKLITDFLIKKIYINGGAYTSKEIIENICQKELSVKPIINYFNNKYNK